jgi:DNA gyrase/topoisomerase IV subunit B
MYPKMLYDIKSGHMYVKMKREYTDMGHAFNALLTNACSNASKEFGINSGRVEILMNETEISIKHYGNGLPIEKIPNTNAYIPEVIYGEGLNGIGICGTTYSLSKYFAVEIQNKNTYYFKSMKPCIEEIIKQTEIKESYIKITYVLDLSNYDMKKYPKHMMNVFAAYCIYCSAHYDTQILFNDVYLPKHKSKYS